MKKIILLCIALITVVSANANTIYEIKYKFQSSDIEYTAFMVRYENKSGFMRINYYNTKREYRVVNLDFDEQQTKRTIDGTEYDVLTFVSKSPVYILGAAGEVYDPDYIWFRKLPSENVYKPWGVTSPAADGVTHQGTVTNVSLLNTNNLTKTYVHSFFGQRESFYVNLFNDTPSVDNPGAIKLIMVANTLDGDIGNTCQKDVDRMKKTFKDIAGTLKMDFTYSEIKDNDFGKQSVLRALGNLTSSYNDIVIFCYSGHGFHYQNDEKNPYPQFDLRLSRDQQITTNTVNVTEVYTSLMRQNAHLKLLLTDCCNSYIQISKPYGQSNPATARSVVQWSRSNCESLFIKQRGVVVASAASLGETAKCNSDYGGFFIFNFLKSLDKSLSVFGSTQSWSNIISETRAAVLDMSYTANCREQICTQTEVAYVNVNP